MISRPIDCGRIVTSCGPNIGSYQRFRRSHHLKMEALLTSETLVTSYKIARRHNTQGKNPHFLHNTGLHPSCSGYQICERIDALILTLHGLALK
jgi:hypothetical protein